MKRTIIVLMLLVGSIAGWNYITLSKPVDTTLGQDSRNHGIEVRVHYHNYISPSVLSFDLRSVSGDNSMADVFRVFLQSSKALREHEFEKVELQYRGDVRFFLEGKYFKQLGSEFDFQNPVYTMRTFTSHLYRPDGTKAFPEWTGGWLGVMTKELDQFSEFHKQWYLTISPTP
ncbi:MAG TPA: hypothetical protein VN736_06050 [Candidatus Limnocylindrales bacterium]|nr:hypothetical protein [Candidatus Limnocylindrales bacterium]